MGLDKPVTGEKKKVKKFKVKKGTATATATKVDNNNKSAPETNGEKPAPVNGVSVDSGAENAGQGEVNQQHTIIVPTIKKHLPPAIEETDIESFKCEQKALEEKGVCSLNWFYLIHIVILG